MIEIIENIKYRLKREEYEFKMNGSYKMERETDKVINKYLFIVNIFIKISLQKLITFLKL